jgi:hypothetical protein
MAETTQDSSALDLLEPQLTDEFCEEVIAEISASSEITRRTLQKRRHDIYKDGGKKFLIDQILREFGKDALNEMRLAPINLLKKIVNKRSSIYKKPPTRTALNDSDQKLIDHYVESLSMNQLMQKANRYFTLASNTVIYTRPHNGKLISNVVPAWLYSVVPDVYDKTKIEVYIFNSFIEADSTIPLSNVPSATGQGANLQTSTEMPGQKIDSAANESELQCRQYIFWTENEHQTRGPKGEKIILDPAKAEEQFVNPIGRLPVVNLAKDRDNEPWATQGEDMVDLTIAIQMGWTDVLTIAKHQGFSILTIVSEEEPKKLTIGINKAVWLKARAQGPAPSISYVQGSSPLSEYKELLMDLLGLLLTTNDMDPQSIGGTKSTRTFTSGFHALIAMADNLEATEADKPILLAAEKDQWDVIKKWHNWMIDSGIEMDEEAKALGRFSDDFEIQIAYADIKPLESEDEVLARIEKERKLELITRRDALKKLYPDLSDKQIDEKLVQLEKEMQAIRDLLAAQAPAVAGLNPDGTPVDPSATPASDIPADPNAQNPNAQPQNSPKTGSPNTNAGLPAGIGQPGKNNSAPTQKRPPFQPKGGVNGG